MINASEFEAWAKRAYDKLAFYNFEHPDGVGVIVTNQSSTPQVLLMSGKILEVKGNNDANIIETTDNLFRICKNLWGEPKVPFPDYVQKQPDLTGKLGKIEITEFLELICDKGETKRDLSWNIYIK